MDDYGAQRGVETSSASGRLRPRHLIETNAGPGPAASALDRLRSRWGLGWSIAWVLACALGGPLSTGCTAPCLLNGECGTDELCLEGQCRRRCTVDGDCPVGVFCLGGGCRLPAPGERPICRDDGGCPPDAALDPMARIDMAVALDMAVDMAIDLGLDASVDAGVSDAGDAGDAAPPVDLAVDQAIVDADLRDGQVDAAGPPFDLTGIYTNTSTVVVATGGEVAPGEVTNRVVTLTLLEQTRYRMEVFTVEGELVFEVADVELASPDGEGHYQFEFTRPVPAPPACEGQETRFQRGSFVELEGGGYRLNAPEDRTTEYLGCGVQGFLIRYDVVWAPLPAPGAP